MCSECCFRIVLLNSRPPCDTGASAQAARLAKANRQLEHDLLVAKSKIEKLQAQHDRQIEHVKSTYQRKIDKLARYGWCLRIRFHVSRRYTAATFLATGVVP